MAERTAAGVQLLRQRCMAAVSRVQLVVVLVGLFVAVILPGARATEYTVGGSNGWNFPPATASNPLTWYNDVWAGNISFKSGDVLVFIYEQGFHDLLQLANEADFSQCTITSPVQMYNSGNDRITIPEGTSYFVCGIIGHCPAGMQLKVVAAAASTGATPPSSPPAAAPSPPPVIPPPTSSPPPAMSPPSPSPVIPPPASPPLSVPPASTPPTTPSAASPEPATTPSVSPTPSSHAPHNHALSPPPAVGSSPSSSPSISPSGEAKEPSASPAPAPAKAPASAASPSAALHYVTPVVLAVFASCASFLL